MSLETGGKPSECNFPAKALLAVRREMARKADSSRDPEVKRLCTQMVLYIQQLRLAHYDLTGCGCWEEAIRQAQGSFPFVPAAPTQMSISEVYGDIEVS